MGQLKRISRSNAAFQEMQALQHNRNKRHRSQTFFLEGVRAIEQALAGGWMIHAWVYDGGRPLSDWARTLLRERPAKVHYELDSPMMQKLSRKNDASELAALVAMRDHPFRPEAQEPFLALLDRPSNKGNLGNVLRSADSFGLQGLFLTGHAVDPYDPDVIASSMGSFFSLPTWQLAQRDELLQAIESLKASWPDLRILGTSAHAAKPLFRQDLRGPILLLLGNEKEGLSAHSKSLCDELLSIPMHDKSSASSLNVASAAAIVFYEASRQRMQGEEQP